MRNSDTRKALLLCGLLFSAVALVSAQSFEEDVGPIPGSDDGEEGDDRYDAGDMGGLGGAGGMDWGALAGAAGSLLGGGGGGGGMGGLASMLGPALGAMAGGGEGGGLGNLAGMAAAAAPLLAPIVGKMMSGGGGGGGLEGLMGEDGEGPDLAGMAAKFMTNGGSELLGNMASNAGMGELGDIIKDIDHETINTAASAAKDAMKGGAAGLENSMKEGGSMDKLFTKLTPVMEKVKTAFEKGGKKKILEMISKHLDIDVTQVPIAHHIFPNPNPNRRSNLILSTLTATTITAAKVAALSCQTHGLLCKALTDLHHTGERRRDSGGPPEEAPRSATLPHCDPQGIPPLRGPNYCRDTEKRRGRVQTGQGGPISPRKSQTATTPSTIISSTNVKIEMSAAPAISHSSVWRALYY